MQKEFDIDIKWTAFPLHPETPAEGLTLEELFAGRPVDIKQVLAHLTRTAKDLGLPFGKREKTYNSRLAQELAKLAEMQGCGEQFHMAAFRAYFVDGLNIGLRSTLMELGTTIGLSAEQVLEVLEKRTFEEAVDQDWRRSYQLGVKAVPTFMINGMSLVGAQPYEKLVQLMEAGGVAKNRS
ncbi:MAG: DsbA family protein [Deltaproteobacteria bacterium]|nr:DsbA family protein [Deltaproteobacteria bacterium]